MKVVIEQAGVVIPARARKDEQPAPGSRAWKDVPILFEGTELIGKIAENGHWIYFSPDNQQWFKLNATNLLLTELLVIKQTIRPTLSDEEKKEKRKARRVRRKEKKAAQAAAPDATLATIQEAKDLSRAQKRKAAKKAAQLNPEE
jgi:hypothetical protein